MKSFLRKTACILMAVSMILSSSLPSFALEDLAGAPEPAPAEQATETDGAAAYEAVNTVPLSSAYSRAESADGEDSSSEEDEETPENGTQAAPSGDAVYEAYSEIKMEIDENALPGSEELLRMRIEKGLGETKTAAAESGTVPLRFSAKKTKALPSGAASYIYSTLQTAVSGIARGTRSDTAITVNLDSYDIKYYSSDFGGMELFNGSTPSEAAIQAAIDKFKSDNADFMTILGMLMADNPYDLYWFDKTSGKTTVLAGFHCSTGDGWISIVSLTFKMAVSADYRGSYDVEAYTTDSSQIGRAMGVVTEIEKVISDNATGTDLQKINAYVKYIEDNTEYNSAAAEAEGPYGDPWQLIFAFDKTDSTDVVCEGYSKAFKYLCDLSTFSDPNVEARTVCGTLDGHPHMWNVVYIGGTNRLVDITNCDGAGSIGYGNRLILRGMEKVDDYTYRTELGSTDHVYKYDEDGEKTVDQFSIYNNGELYIYWAGYAEASLDCPDGAFFYSDHEDVVVTPSMIFATPAPLEILFYDWSSSGKPLGDGSTYTIKPGTESPGDHFLSFSMAYDYDGCTYIGRATIRYTIADKEVYHLDIEHDADKTSGYVHGDTADITGLVLRAYYNDLTSSIVTPESITYSSGPYLKKGDLSYSVNYGGKSVTANIGTVKAKPATVTDVAALDRVYDATSEVTLSGGTLTGIIAGETVGFTLGVGTMADKNAGTGKAVTTAIALTGADAGNYILSQPDDITVNIAKKEVTVNGLSAQNKVYDGTVTASVTNAGASFDGIVAGDTLSVSTTGTFSDAAVGSGKTVTFGGLVLGGADSANYKVKSGSQTASTASITEKGLTLTGVTAAAREYDGTLSVELSGGTLEGAKEGDEVGFTLGVGAMADKNAGTGKAVTTSVTLTGAQAGNYALIQPDYVTVDISKKAVVVTGLSAVDKVYDGTVAATVTDASASFDGIVAGDTLSVSTTGTFSDAAVGSGKTVTFGGLVLGGADSANYSVKAGSQTADTAGITPAVLTITGVAALDRVYDATSEVTLSGGTLTGIIAGETVGFTLGVGTMADKNAGTGKAVTTAIALTGADAGNYILSQPDDITVNIAKKEVTVNGLSAQNKVYDGTVTATVTDASASFEGIVAGDTLTVSTTGTFSDAAVGSGKTVTFGGLVLGGADSANYKVKSGSQTGTTASITEKGLTLTGVTAVSREYDGTLSVELSGGTLEGAKEGDEVGFTLGVGAMADKNAGTGKAVTTSVTLTGAQAGNYSLTQPDYVTVDISKKAVKVTGITSSSKTYDGTVAAAADASSATLSGKAAGDDLGISVTGSFNDPEVMYANTVYLSVTLTGADKDNYTLSGDSQTTYGATVIPKAVTLSYSGPALTKVYDGSAVYYGTVYLTSTDIDAIEGAGAYAEIWSGMLDSSDVAFANSVSFDHINSAHGFSPANYDISYGTAPASITPKEINVTGITAENKVYDKSDSATLSYSSAQFDGAVSGDDLSVSATGTFSDAKAGTGKTVSITGLTLGGADAGNYSLGAGCQTETAADITKKTISSFDLGSCTKAFDGTVTAADFSVAPASGQVIAGDDVSVSYAPGTAVYSDPYVGTGKTVTVAKENIVLTGADSGCYQVASDITRSDGAITVGSQSPTILPIPSIAKGGNSIDLKPYVTGVMGGAAVTFSKSSGVTGASVTSDGVLTSGDATGTYKVTLSIAAVDVNGDSVSECNALMMPAAITVEIVEKNPAVINYTAPASKTYGDGNFTITASYEDGPESGGTWTWSADGTVFEIVSGGSTATALVKVKKAAATGGYVRAQYETDTYLGYKQTEIPVDQAVLQIGGIKAENKVYDGTAEAVLDYSGAGFTGAVDGDDISVSTTGTFPGKDAGSNQTVSLGTLVLGGADAANYVIDHGMSQHATVASITPKPVTVTGVAATDREYDSETSVEITGGTIVGKVAGDVVSLVLGTGHMTDANAGTGKTVTTGITLSGADAGNYTVTQPDYVTVDIAKKEVTVSGITAEDKTYDGTTAAVVNDHSIVTGYGEILNISTTGTFSDANAADDKTVTLGPIVLLGPAAVNYSVKSDSQTTATASITKKTVTITGVSATGRAYDGTADIALTCSGGLVGVLGADTAVTYSLGTGTASDKNAGTGKAVTTAITLTGTGSGNYQLTQPDYVTVDIAKKEVTVGGITADDKTYDGTNAATLATGSATFTGIITGDALTVSATGVFSDRNAGTGKTVTISAVSLGGADAGNYAVKSDSQTTATAAIARADVTVSGIRAESKTYDGTTAAVTDASEAVFTGLVQGDELTVSATGTFADANAGTGKTVTIGTFVLGGTDAANYNVDTGASQTEAAADITRAALTVTASGTVSKTYDGTTAWTGAKDLDLTGLVSADSAGKITATAGTYNSKNVSEADKVTITAATPSGFDPANYSYTLPQLTASIDKLSVTVTITGPTAKTYGESFEHAAYATLVGSDTSDYTVEYDGGPKPADAGTYAVTAAMSNGNYDPVTTPFSFVISPAEITTLHDAAVNIRAGDTSPNVFPASIFGTAPVDGTWHSGMVIFDPDSLICTSFGILSGTGEVSVRFSGTAAAGNKMRVSVSFTPSSSNYVCSGLTALTVNVIDKEPVTPAVSIAGWTYGSAANAPSADPGITDSYPATNAQTVFRYEGTGSTVYPESETVPTAPGTYTARAYYEDDNHKGIGSADFVIAKKQLSWTGLTVSDKVYDGSRDALSQLAGTLGISGAVNDGEATAGTGAPSSAAFADAYIGSGKSVTVIVSGTVGGTHPEYYEAPSATLVLSGNIVSPAEPVREADASSTTLTVSGIETAVITASMTDAGYGTADSVKAALAGKAGEDVGEVTSNAVYYSFDISGTTDSTIFVPYPAGTDSSRTFAVAVMKADGTMEKISSSAMTAIPGGFRFTTSETGAMAVAVAWDVPAPTPAPEPSGRGGSSGSDNPIVVGGSRIWSEAKKQIAASSGKSTVTVDAGSSTTMPWDVMEALRQNPDVTLVIKRDGKSDIVIPGGEALEHKAGTDSYSLDDLAETFGEGTAEYVTGPYVFRAYSDQEQEEEATEPAEEPVTEAPETPGTEGKESEEGEETEAPAADAEGGAAAPGEEERKGINPLVIAVPSAAAVIGGAALLLRKKHD